METFIMVHPSLPECIGDAPTLAAWAADGWKRKDAEPEADKPAKDKK